MTADFFEILHRSGIGALARLRPNRYLVAMSLHRVLEGTTPFDDAIIEATPARFREHLEWLSRHADFLSESQVKNLRHGGRPKILLTFDDGYRDAHEVIAPLLEKMGIPAIFFVAPGMLDERRLGAWDVIAYLLKNFRGASFRFRGREFSLSGGHRPLASAFSTWSKSEIPDQGERFVRELAAALDVELPSKEAQSSELLTWDQTRDLARRGFSIGCHALSHRALSSLLFDEQEREVREALARLEAEGLRPTSFAYPYGSSATYSWETREIVKRAGFDLIFSHDGLATRLPSFDPHGIDRVAFKSSVAKYDFLLSFPRVHNFAHRARGGHET